MLTARSRSEDIRLAMELGANDFVGKPFESEELMARVAVRRYQELEEMLLCEVGTEPDPAIRELLR